MYQELIKLSGQKCKTISYDIEAEMQADTEKVMIIYKSGNVKYIPREIVENAINRLVQKGFLTKDEVHYEITDEDGPMTDRLMAVLRMLPGVEIKTRIPRELIYKSMGND